MKTMQLKRRRLAIRMLRVRKRVNGTPARPRLAVTRSHANITAQIIDDMAGRTLCAVSTLEPEVKTSVGYGGNCKAAVTVGKLLAEKARAKGIEQVCFDRRGRRYHGRVKALADAAREAGLKF